VRLPLKHKVREEFQSCTTAEREKEVLQGGRTKELV